MKETFTILKKFEKALEAMAADSDAESLLAKRGSGGRPDPKTLNRK